MHYDTESNIISWEVSKSAIANTKRFGNFIIHLSAKKKPVLIEILEADKFVEAFGNIKNIKQIPKLQFLISNK